MDNILAGVRRRHTFYGTTVEVYVDHSQGDIFTVFRVEVTDGHEKGKAYPIALCLPIEAAFAMANDFTEAFETFSRQVEAGELLDDDEPGQAGTPKG